MFCLAFLVCCPVPGYGDSTVWMMEDGSPARTGLSAFSGPQRGCIKWTFSSIGPINSSIAIGSAGQMYLASEDGFLYAIDPNGTEIWKYSAGNGVFTSPSLGNDGTIYIGSVNQTLYAIDPNGTVNWTFPADAPLVAAPVVTADYILVGSAKGTLYAIHPNGILAWTFAPNHPDSIFASPSVDSNGTIYIGRLYDPNLYALNPADGSVFWSTDLSHNIIPDNPATNIVHTGFQIAPVIHPDGFVLATPAYDCKLYALDSSTGDILWSCNLYQSPKKPPNFGTSYQDWMYTINYGYSDIWSQPVIGPDGTIYVSMDDMYLRAINPDGSIKWIARIGMYGGLTMTVAADGRIYAASDDKSLYVLNPDDGGIISLWTIYDTLTNTNSIRQEEWLSFPVLGPDGTLYVSSSRNKLYAVSSENCSSYDLHWPQDTNQDNEVSLKDMVQFSQDWLGCMNTIFFGQGCTLSSAWYPFHFPYLKADLNRDFTVNIEDLNVFIENWLTEESL
jgi:outer membrane protein assembly factor BamB